MIRDDPFEPPPNQGSASDGKKKLRSKPKNIDEGRVSAGPATAAPTVDEKSTPEPENQQFGLSVLDQCLAASSMSPAEQLPVVTSGDDLAKLSNLLRHNLLYAAAISLFGIIGQLRGSSAPADASDLHRRIVAAVNSFEQQAFASGYDADIVQTARYCLCSAVDEVALSTEWAISSVWAQQSLLYTFHSDLSGGRTFFAKLDEVRASISERASDSAVDAEIDLLEVLYICLALGFAGKYRIVAEGEAKLEQLRHAIFTLITEQRAAISADLSPSWRSASIAKRTRSFLPAWLTVLLTMAVLLSVYIMLNHNLNQRSDLTFAQIQTIGRDVSFEFDRSVPILDEAQEWWRDFDVLFEVEISRNVLDLIDTPKAITIRIFNNGLFRSASASISDDYRRVFERIGQAIEDRVPGAVTVMGHSDNLPIRSVRFPSNWHLSKARAEAVANAISPSLSDPSRLSFEGRSDNDPIASNATPEGQAANRRVEIVLPKVVPMADAMSTASENSYWPDE